jgi:hypothetical protein
MAKKPTVSALRQMVEELLGLHAAVERYGELESAIKSGMLDLKYKEITTAKGRVFISVSERVAVSPDLAREVLKSGALRIIRTKEYVPNELIKAFCEVGDITEAQRAALLAGAQKTPVTALHVRPLK